MGRKMQDLTGMKMHRLTFLEHVGKTKYGNAIWKVQCECGTVFDVEGANVKRGITRSCGCLRAERNRQRLLDRAYKCWHCGYELSLVGSSKVRAIKYYVCPDCNSSYEFRQGRKEE